MKYRVPLFVGWSLLLVFLVTLAAVEAQEPARPVRVTIQDGKATAAEVPIDPTQRIQVGYSGGMYLGMSVDGKRITCTPESSVFTAARIDNQEVQPGINVMNGQLAQPQPLPPGPFGKKRLGTQVNWSHNNLHFTQIVEIVPSRIGSSAPGQKRRLDTARISYLVENKDTRDHQVEFRTFVDTMIADNDGALFASPTTHPGKVLDGVMFKDRTIPEYLQVLEKPNLMNPGFVAAMTLKFGGKTEGPSKVVLTNTGVFGMGGWDAAPQQAGGDSALFLFWAPKTLKPGQKREMVWAYGGGVASNPENEGKVALALGGSFEPGKVFTVLATVADPVPSQTLTLELPAGMEHVEGRDRQPVPPPQDSGHSLVLWKARVAQTGEFELRVRSSTGVIQIKNISIQSSK